MANDCMNSIIFYSTDEMKIKKLHSDFNQHFSQDIKKVYSVIKNMGYDYCGKVLVEFRDRFTEIDEVESKKLEDKTFYYFLAYTESAWTPNMQIFKALIKEEPYKGIELVHMSEEEGDDIYINTDTTGIFFDARYCMQICYKDVDDYFFDDDYSNIVKQVMLDFPNAGIREDDTIDDLRRKIEPFLDEDDTYKIIEYDKECHELSLEEKNTLVKGIIKDTENYLAKQSA